MFQSSDTFIVGSSYTIGVLLACWNKLAIEASPRLPPARTKVNGGGAGSTWPAVLAKLEMKLDRRTVNDFFARLEVVEEVGDVVVVREPSAGVAAMIRRCYPSALEEACDAVRRGLRIRLLGVDGKTIAATETEPSSAARAADPNECTRGER